MSRLRTDSALQLRLVRFWLPLVVVAVGIVFMVVATDLAGLEGGALIVTAGVSIWLLNWLYRVGIAGEHERVREDDARSYYARTGHWPDEAQAPAAAPRPSPAAAPAAEPVPPRPHPHRTPGRHIERPRRPRRR